MTIKQRTIWLLTSSSYKQGRDEGMFFRIPDERLDNHEQRAAAEEALKERQPRNKEVAASGM